jgi:predicted glutamine amidotransferase
MCGIICAFNRDKPVNEAVMLQFEDQSSRGMNGFGAMLIDKTGKFTVKRATGQVKAIIDLQLNPSEMIVFHHRQPSSSRNKISQTHPILIAHKTLEYDYLFIHNGCISEYGKRKKEHKKEYGYKYSTESEEYDWNDKKQLMFNDSECLGFDIALFIEHGTKIKTVGSAAFVMVQINKKTQKVTRVYYGRNSSNPLHFATNKGKKRKEIFLSSEGPGKEIKANKLYWFNPLATDMKINSKEMKIVAFVERPAPPVVTGFGLNSNYSNDAWKRKDDGVSTLVPVRTGGVGNSFDDDDDDYSDEFDQLFVTSWMNAETKATMKKYYDAITAIRDELFEDLLLARDWVDLELVDKKDKVLEMTECIEEAVETATTAAETGLVKNDYAPIESEYSPIDNDVDFEKRLSNVSTKLFAK